MKALGIVTSLLLVMSFLGGALALHWRSQAQALAMFQATAERRTAESGAELLQLRAKVQADERRLAAVERELEQELEQAGSPEAGRTRNQLSKDLVRARLAEARRLAKAQDYPSALGHYVWTLEVALRWPRRFGVDWQALLAEVQGLQERHAPTRDELLKLSSRFGALLLSDPDSDASCLACLNKQLGVSYKNLALYDQLPAGSTKRSTLVIYDREVFVEARRYREVAACYGFSMMDFAFERNSAQLGVATGMPANLRERMVADIARDIEVLAGVNDLEHAASLASRFLPLAGSGVERMRIQKALTRAGHPELWESLGP